MIWLKTLHIAGLAVWCACLFALPALFRARNDLAVDPERYKLQRLTRAVFIAIASPAAFVTIASGTALIFLRPVLEPWFALKLGLVGGLVALHVWTGLIVLHVFLPQGTYRVRHAVLGFGGTTLMVAAILWGVLHKPAIDLDRFLPEGAMAPGALGEATRSVFHRWRS